MDARGLRVVTSRAYGVGKTGTWAAGSEGWKLGGKHWEMMP